MKTRLQLIQDILGIKADDDWGSVTQAALDAERSAAIRRRADRVTRGMARGLNDDGSERAQVPSAPAQPAVNVTLIADGNHNDPWPPPNSMPVFIHKGTEGSSYADPLGHIRYDAWKAAHRGWGWYHFSDGSDPVAQANHFLEYIAGRADDSDLLVLDYENSSRGGRDMTAAEAEKWLATVRAARPNATLCVYGSNLLTEALQANPDAFAGCLLWPARYRANPPTLPDGRKWHIWQFTGSGTSQGYPYDDMDKVFMSEAELRAKWPRLDS